MTDEDDELAELRAQSTSGGGNRIDADQKKSESAVDDLVASMEKVEDGDLSKTISFWDPEGAAILNVLLSNPERLKRFAEACGDRLETNVDVEDADRSDVLKLAWRVGLAEVDPELLENAREARRKRAIEKADEGL